MTRATEFVCIVRGFWLAVEPQVFLPVRSESDSQSCRHPDEVVTTARIRS
jgi:hypothetical protein